MRSLIHPITRSILLASTRGAAVAFDCLECDGGLYASFNGCRPICTVCGALCPDDVWAVMRDACASAPARQTAA